MLWSVASWLLGFFFFQAEDGIRDLTVTGVQTCALPIWSAHVSSEASCEGGGVPSTSLVQPGDRKSTRLNSSHSQISYAVFCLKKKKKDQSLPKRDPTTTDNTT